MYLLTYFLLCLLAHRAATKSLHSLRSSASRLSCPQVFPPFRISASTVLRHAIFCLPRRRLPSGVQYSAVLARDSLSCWSTCPIHVHLRFIIVCDIGRLPHFCRSTSFGIVSGQKIFIILWRLLIWKALTLRAQCQSSFSIHFHKATLIQHNFGITLSL